MSTYQWKNRRVLVTGATGLLGSHLVEKLVQKNASVVALIRDEVPYSFLRLRSLDQKIISVFGDVTDFRLMERILGEYEVETVFHLAAQTIVGIANQSPYSTLETNIRGTYSMLDACRFHRSKIKEIIVASSDKAYGHLSRDRYDEAQPLQGKYPYDVSKSCADLISQMYFYSFQLPVSITRCGNFFGPGDLNFNRLIPGTIRECVNGTSPIIRSDGKFIRDYIYVEDAVSAYLILAENIQRLSLQGQAFNFSYGEERSVLEVVKEILKKMNLARDPVILNEASNEIPVQILSNAKAKDVLDWKPHYGFDEGLKKTIDWYQENLTSVLQFS